MKRPLGAQISHMLKERGVEVIFGIPGVHNQELYRGIEEAGITHVLARHEQGAGFMADGYARATGQPGVAYVISGPGLTNIMTPMGQAYSDSVPLLVISSCLDETAATRGQLHQMKDQRAAAATVCDWSEEARSAEAAYALIDRAFMEFATDRPRTKHIQVPIALLEGLAEGAPLAGYAPSSRAADPSDCRDLAEALSDAERPLVILGGGACFDGAAESITQALGAWGAAAFVTYAGRGLVAPTYPLFFGSMLGRASSADVIASADLVVAIGTELAEVDLWRSTLGHDGPLYRVDVDPEVLSDRHMAEWSILGQARDVFETLGLCQIEKATGWKAEEVAAARTRWRAEIAAERPGILPAADALRQAVPEDTMIYSDMTQFAYAAKEVWDMARPGHWHHPTGFGTLGYATPAAIGGAMARPDKPTMAIIGDYGFQYTLQELATAVELEVCLPIFLWDNDGLGEIKDSMVRAQIAPRAVTTKNPDFCKLAEAFGARAAKPSTLQEMTVVVEEACATAGPTLIHMRAGKRI